MTTPTYAGGVQATKDLLSAEWTTTAIGFENGEKPTAEDVNGELIPWVFCEIDDTEREVKTIDLDGQRLHIQYFDVWVSIYVPAGTGDALVREYADSIAAILMNRRVYNSTPGYLVRTRVSEVHRGVKGSDDGKWWRRSVSVPCEYWHTA